MRFEVVGDRVTIGRQGTCSVHIPDTNVSRVHAELRRTPNGWTVEDRGSTNGTKVNGTLIVEPTTVQLGDTLSFGSVTLTFVRG
jgi:pSer/pThr/pTyr-binding forkhead associated (FHA) protein